MLNRLVMLSLPGALLRFNRLMASVGRMGGGGIFIVFLYAWRTVLEVVWCYRGWYRIPHTSWSSCPGRECAHHFLLFLPRHGFILMDLTTLLFSLIRFRRLPVPSAAIFVSFCSIFIVTSSVENATPPIICSLFLIWSLYGVYRHYWFSSGFPFCASYEANQTVQNIYKWMQQ